VGRAATEAGHAQLEVASPSRPVVGRIRRTEHTYVQHDLSTLWEQED
jgi:hypothetical protein